MHTKIKNSQKGSKINFGNYFLATSCLRERCAQAYGGRDRAQLRKSAKEVLSAAPLRSSLMNLA
jgi:hypothetical protein